MNFKPDLYSSSRSTGSDAKKNQVNVIRPGQAPGFNPVLELHPDRFVFTEAIK